MFAIKGKHYKVEYEGLHLLCLGVDIYGHDTTMCGIKMQVGRETSSKEGDIVKDIGKVQDLKDIQFKGAWNVVKKPKRTRKQNSV